MVKKIFCLTAAVLLLATGLSFSAEPVKIGVVLPFTGPVGADGDRTYNGIKLAVEEINNQGGLTINGEKRKIELISEDSTCNPKNSVASTEKLMTRNKVSIVIGDFCSTSTLADAEVARRNKVPQVTPISIAPSITQQKNSWIFRACDNSDMMARAFVQYGVNELGLKRWAFLARNDDYGRGSVKSLQPLIEKNGGKVVAVEYHPQGATDYYTLLTKIRAKKPDGLALIANTSEHAVATNQIAELGLNKEVRLLDPTSAYFNEDFLRITGPNSNGMVGPTRYVHIINTAKNREFVGNYKKTYGSDPDKFAQSAYETVKMVAKAMEKAQDVSPKAVRDALAKVRYPGLQGREYYFTDNNQIVIDEFIIQVKNGKYEILSSVKGEEVVTQ